MAAGWLLAILLALSAVYLYILRQGDEETAFVLSARSPLVCLADGPERLSFALALPLANTGRQDGFVMDAFARALLPQEQFAAGRVSCSLERAEARRADGYLEAFIARAGQREDFILTLEFTPSAGCSLDELRRAIPDLTVDIYHNVVGRTRPKIKKSVLTIPLEEFEFQADGQAGL